MMTADVVAWLMQGAIAATVALLCVLALRPPMRALFGARVAYPLWLLVPGALLAVSLPGPAMDFAAHAVASEGAAAAPSVRVGLATALQPVASVFAAPRISNVAYIAWLWAFGALAMAWWQWRLQRRFVSALGALTPRGDGVFVSASTSTSPAVIGALRPRIVLPADFDARYPAAERALVIAHEREHVRRRDVPVNLAVAALRCLHWFNPLLHWAAAKFRFDQELACDAAVLARHPDSRRAYAGAMLKRNWPSLDCRSVAIGIQPIVEGADPYVEETITRRIAPAWRYRGAGSGADCEQLWRVGVAAGCNGSGAGTDRPGE